MSGRIYTDNITYKAYRSSRRVIPAQLVSLSARSSINLPTTGLFGLMHCNPLNDCDIVFPRNSSEQALIFGINACSKDSTATTLLSMHFKPFNAIPISCGFMELVDLEIFSVNAISKSRTSGTVACMHCSPNLYHQYTLLQRQYMIIHGHQQELTERFRSIVH